VRSAGVGRVGAMSCELRLPGAVRIHLEQALDENLAAVAVFPARVDNSPIGAEIAVDLCRKSNSIMHRDP